MTEQEKMIQMQERMRDFCRDVATNDANVFGALMAGVSKMGELADGLDNMSKTVENGTDENVRKQLRNTMVSVREVCRAQMQMMSILAIYVASGEAGTHAAQSAVKFGASGEDILKGMFRSKFGRM